jgi:hypothetical protein
LENYRLPSPTRGTWSFITVASPGLHGDAILQSQDVSAHVNHARRQICQDVSSSACLLTDLPLFFYQYQGRCGTPQGRSAFQPHYSKIVHSSRYSIQISFRYTTDESPHSTLVDKWKPRQGMAWSACKQILPLRVCAFHNGFYYSCYRQTVR